MTGLSSIIKLAPPVVTLDFISIRVDSSLQDAVQLNKWRSDYNIVLLWIGKAEEKQNLHDEDGDDDIDKLKKQRKTVIVSDVQILDPAIIFVSSLK